MNFQKIFYQAFAFFNVGLAAAVVHYSTLALLILVFHFAPVRATLVGYFFGGLVSYGLNRTYTFPKRREHLQASWRFLLVAAVGFLLTYCLMHWFVDQSHFPWFPAQIATTAIVMLWSFVAHKLWTF